ncbi:hypothetical protein Taro_014958, partial [Colocasia esculenta]|nr:hypothetical protein [Colocasia esculenta]
LSHTQESTRRFIEAAWVPLHRVGQKAQLSGYLSHFLAAGTYPQFFWTAGRLCNLPGRQGISAIFQASGYFCNFLGQQGICVLLYTHTQTLSPHGVLCNFYTNLGPHGGLHMKNKHVPHPQRRGRGLHLPAQRAIFQPRNGFPEGREKGCQGGRTPRWGCPAQGSPRWGWFCAGTPRWGCP